MQDAKNCQKIAVWAPSHDFVGLYLRNEGTYRQSEKLVKQQYLLHMSQGEPHNTSGWDRFVSLGHPANFNRFRVLASMQRRRSTEANQTFHNVWPLPGLVDYIYTFGGCCSLEEFCQAQNSLCVLQVLCSPIGSVTARQSSSGESQTLRRWAQGATVHLYSAGRPSRWVLAHILVACNFMPHQTRDQRRRVPSAEGMRTEAPKAPNGVGHREGCPLLSRLQGLEECHELSYSGVWAESRQETHFGGILKATENAAF